MVCAETVYLQNKNFAITKEQADYKVAEEWEAYRE
jgi:hypothetical protein